MNAGLYDITAHGAVPTMIAQSTEEALVNGAPHEYVNKRIARKHVLQRVPLRFNPELVASLITFVASLYGADSQALTITVSSFGESIGRMPSRNSLVKKSSQEVNP